MSFYTEEELKMNEKFGVIKNCCYEHNLGKIKHLLSDFDVNYVYYDGAYSLLHEALSYGKLDNSKVIELLIHHGADVAYKGKNKTSLMFAVNRGVSIESMKLLVKHGVDIHAEDDKGCNALCYAMRNEYTDIAILKYFRHIGIRIKHCHLERYVDPDAEPDNIHFIEELVKYDSFADVTTEFNYLLESVEDVYHAKLLIENGCDVNHKSLHEHTPLYFAAKSKNMDLVKYFIACGAEISQKTVGEIFSVEYAKFLMSHGYDVVNHFINHEYSCDDVDLLRYIVSLGISIKNGILLYNARRDNYDVVKFIINNNLVDIHEKNCDGQTILHDAVDLGNIKFIKILLENGVDINVKDEDGNLPDDLTSNKKIISLLNKNRKKQA